MSPFTPNASAAAARFRLRGPPPALAVTLCASGTRVTGFAVTPLVAGEPAAGPPDARVRFRALGPPVTRSLADVGSDPQPVAPGEPADARGRQRAAPRDGRHSRAGRRRRARRRAPRPWPRHPPVALTVAKAVDRTLRARAAHHSAPPGSGRRPADDDAPRPRSTAAPTWTTLATAGDPATVRLDAADLPRSRARTGAPARHGRRRVSPRDGHDRAAHVRRHDAHDPDRRRRVRRAPPRRRRDARRPRSATTPAPPSAGARQAPPGGPQGRRSALGRLPAGRHRLHGDARQRRARRPITVTVRAAASADPRRASPRLRASASPTDVPVTVRANGRRIGRLAGNASRERCAHVASASGSHWPVRSGARTIRLWRRETPELPLEARELGRWS